MSGSIHHQMPSRSIMGRWLSQRIPSFGCNAILKVSIVKSGLISHLVKFCGCWQICQMISLRTGDTEISGIRSKQCSENRYNIYLKNEPFMCFKCYPCWSKFIPWTIHVCCIHERYEYRNHDRWCHKCVCVIINQSRCKSRPIFDCIRSVIEWVPPCYVLRIG